MMDFPVAAEFVASANPAQLHGEARGAVAADEWPACFVETQDGWVYRVQRDDVDAGAVQAALDAHTPDPLPPDPDEALDAALGDIDTSTISDQATRDVLDQVIASLRGTGGRAARAAGRPTE